MLYARKVKASAEEKEHPIKRTASYLLPIILTTRSSKDATIYRNIKRLSSP